MNDADDIQQQQLLQEDIPTNPPAGVPADAHEETIRAYQRTAEALRSTSQLSNDISSLSSLVSLHDVVDDGMPVATPWDRVDNHGRPLWLDESRPLTGIASLDDRRNQTDISLRASLRSVYGQQLLNRALEQLEQPSSAGTSAGTTAPAKETALEHSLLQELTELITDTRYESYMHAQQSLLDLGHSIPRRVCQHPFRRNDIVWVCRTCQADETCVLCHNCFTNSNHEGHDVAFYHAQAGGCCDCGDPDAWDSNGFCPWHGPQAQTTTAPTSASTSSTTTTTALTPDTVHRVEGVVPAVADWLVKYIATQQVEAHQRAQRMTSRTTTSLAPFVAAAASLPEIRNLDDEEEEFLPDEEEGARRAGGGWTDVALPDDEMQRHHQVGLDPALVHMGHVFVPAAASTSKSRHGDTIGSQIDESLARQLGTLGRDQHGLYIILHADEIHSVTELQDALRALLRGDSRTSDWFFNDSLLQRVANALRIHGQLIVWGTMELLTECSPTQVSCWNDGDRVALERVGGILLRRASNLVQTHGLVWSIATRSELQWEQRAVAVLQWLGLVARSCDPLCQTVASCLLSNEHLVPLLRADFSLGAPITKAWHSLLLTLLAVPTLKRRLAAAYCDTYPHVTAEYARGRGTSERSGYTLSVQFLNRVTYVVDLVAKRDLLGKLGKALSETLAVAAIDSGSTAKARGPLNPNHFVLTHRRYTPCIADLKCVSNVDGIPRLFLSPTGTFLNDWMYALSLAQGMDGHIWRTQAEGHVQVEPRGWVGAFNASISLASLYDRLLSWDDDDVCPVDPVDSNIAQNRPTAVDVTFQVLTEGIARWQTEAMDSFSAESGGPSSPGGYRMCTQSLPFSTLAAKHGTPLAFTAMPISQVSPWSFHMPLHRFLAACIREVSRRRDEGHGSSALLDRLQREIDISVLRELFRGLMEFSMLVLSRAAQIRANLWQRNGSCMRDQVINYGEPPFCRTLRDSDILLLQFAALGLESPDGRDVGCSTLVHLMLHRLGLFDTYAGLIPAPDTNLCLYEEETQAGLYPIEYERYRRRPLDPSRPWSFSPVEDSEAAVALVEEALHLLIVLISELPPSAPNDKLDHTKRAKRRLRREVIHRLASGPKTHSELTEVQHVLSYWDNTYLSEEGKLLNPDDASGAALGQALAEVAERKSSRVKLTPDQWELRRSAWEDYDPAFYHISVADHQKAAENRPKPATRTTSIGIEPKQYAPFHGKYAHPAFRRLQRDLTADSTVISILYRTIHVHCRAKMSSNDRSRLRFNEILRGPLAYANGAMSETVLARTVHLLTIGACAWEDAPFDDLQWKDKGGGAAGSIFFHSEGPAPTCHQWVSRVLLADPCKVMDSEGYRGEDNALVLLQRLATGDNSSVFAAQDQSVRAGAAWLCEFAGRNNPDAANSLRERPGVVSSTESEDFERKKREAKAKAHERMQAQAAKFAAMMQLEADDDDEQGMRKTQPSPTDESSGAESTPRRLVRPGMSRSSTFESEQSTSSSRSPQRGDLGIPQFFSMYSSGGEATMDGGDYEIPDRLLKDRPRCIICAEEGPSIGENSELSGRKDSEDKEGNRKRSRQKTERSNVLAFVGYSQSSTVLKGGGGPPPRAEDPSPLACLRRFTGTHVALCGHAVHSECCESYLATTLHREERRPGRREEFRCPACQRLSNSLIPFIDVGINWCSPVSQAEVKQESMSMLLDGDSGTKVSTILPPTSLHDFVSSTPWWVGRNDKGAVWDGQCAFVGTVLPEESGPLSQTMVSEVDESPSKGKRRRIRSLRKRDLYAAWNAMMRTPRFMRKRRFRQKSSSNITDESSTSTRGDPFRWPVSEASSSGETVVWRRFMDLLSDLGYKADIKRIGENQLALDCGEFRHYHVEKFAYNIANRKSGKEMVEWPACISTTMLGDMRRQELSREKLLSKLLISIQSFVYSCCCESAEARRLLQTEAAGLIDVDGNASTRKAILSKYGIRGVTCDGILPMMTIPQPNDNDGKQPFDGRLGKMRYFGLSLMAAAGAVSADLVQLVLCLPLDNGNEKADMDAMNDDEPLRAPIVFPLLSGHVLTHVTAAMCAACGWARARSDSLELAWPVPFSSRGSFYGSISEGYHGSGVDMLVRDCEGFIKLGLLARILQVLLSKLAVDTSNDQAAHISMANSLMSLTGSETLTGVGTTKGWARGCLVLVCEALSRDSMPVKEGEPAENSPPETLATLFSDACTVAAEAAVAFLADASMILQILVPGVSIKYRDDDGDHDGGDDDDDDVTSSKRGENRFINSLLTLKRLQATLSLEPLENMVRSSLVHGIVHNWMHIACSFAQKGHPNESSDLTILVQKRLFRNAGFRSHDWPMGSVRAVLDKEKLLLADSTSASGVDSMQLDMQWMKAERGLRQESSPLVSFSSQKRVALLGGYSDECFGPMNDNANPRIALLPTSYTDLYAELGVLRPDSEQTALCLICGEVLNAGGKGECTRHSFQCGAGSCIFFLLQECLGLLMHNGKAVYAHSPYVDSHGETPQYRGRPLNLDMDRYEVLRELWSGHSNRQKVISERGSNRQQIILDFY